jgi:hypothetical protein
MKHRSHTGQTEKKHMIFNILSNQKYIFLKPNKRRKNNSNTFEQDAPCTKKLNALFLDCPPNMVKRQIKQMQD